MVRAAIESRVLVETDAEVPADTRRIDLWFMPDPTRESTRDHLGLLGRITALKRAIAELKALSAEAPERTLALPILLRLRLDVPTDPAKQTADDQEYLMNTQDIVDTWRREAIQEGRASALIDLIDLYEARFGTMPDDIRALIEDTHDELTLRAWVKLAGTCSASDIAATIRATRAS